MKKFKLCFIVLLGGLLFMFNSCSTESLNETESLDGSLTSARGADISIGESFNPMKFALPGENTVFKGDGSASLVRNKNGISLQVHSTGLTPGNAYTAWFIVFDGAAGPVVAPIVVNAAGNIVGRSGNATFAGHLSTGKIGEPNGLDILGDGGDGSFDYPMNSFLFIHIVDHGPAVAGTIPENIHYITGAVGLAQEWVFDPGN